MLELVVGMIEVSVWRLFDMFGDSAELRDLVELIKKISGED